MQKQLLVHLLMDWKMIMTRLSNASKKIANLYWKYLHQVTVGSTENSQYYFMNSMHAAYSLINTHHLSFPDFSMMQQILDCMFLIFWVIQYSKKSFLQYRKASLGPFLLENLKNS